MSLTISQSGLGATNTLPRIRHICGVPITPLLALAKFVCDADDVRYNVNSVYIDPEGYLVATNGVMMVAIGFKAHSANTDQGVMLSAKSIVEFNKMYPQKTRQRESFELIDIEEGWHSEHDGNVVLRAFQPSSDTMIADTFPAIPGRYISWRQAMPTPVLWHTGMPAQLSPRHLHALDSLVRQLKGTKDEDVPQIEVIHCGPNRPAHIIAVDKLDWEFRAILMPYGSTRIEECKNPLLLSLSQRLKHFDNAEVGMYAATQRLDSLLEGNCQQGVLDSIRYASTNLARVQDALTSLRHDLLNSTHVDIRKAA